jgi:hypothetical protein
MCGEGEEGRINAGVAIDYIFIDDPYGCVLERYGEPDFSYEFDMSDFKMGEGLALYFSFEELGLSGYVVEKEEGAVDELSPIYQVFAREPYSGKTDGGCGIGSNFYEVKEEFGECESEREENDNTICDYPSIGISFRIDEDKVIKIWVY